MSDYHPPARVAVLGEIVAVGVVVNVASSKEAQQLERFYGDNFQEVVTDDDGIVAYYA